MATRRMFVLTGTAAWVGGMATALAVASCEPEVDASDLDEDIVLAPEAGEHPDGPLPEMRPQEVCDVMARPSAYVSIVETTQDFSEVVQPSHVWFEYGGEVHDADCLQGEVQGQEGCTAWITGYEVPGRIEVFAEYCDTVVSHAFDVGLTSNGCHVDTRFIQLEAETRGCLATGPKPEAPPTPGPSVEH